MYRMLWSVVLVIVLAGSALGQSEETSNKTLAESLGIKWVFIPGGTFEMGDVFGDGYDNQKPVHTVTLSPYYLSATEEKKGVKSAFDP